MTTVVKSDPSDVEAVADLTSPQVDGSIPNSRGLVRYLISILLPTVVLYFLPFALIRMPSYERWAGSEFGPALDFAFQTAGQNADVVIYSDSSGLFGINPRLLSDELKLKCLNLPNTAGSLPVTGEVVLNRYLRTNRPPKLIVFYLTPWTLDYSHDANMHIFEGEEMLLRHGSAPDIWNFARKNMAASLQFSFQVYALSLKQIVMRKFEHADPVASVAENLGHVEARTIHLPIISPCTLPAFNMERSGFETTRELVAHYTNAATKTLVFIAPVPICTNTDKILNRSYEKLGAAPPREMSPEMYLGDFNYAHLFPKAVPEVTLALAKAIRSKLEGSSESRP